MERSCRKALRDPIGQIFCANFGKKREEFAPCVSAWCPACYDSPKELKFPKVELVDEEGFDMPQADTGMFLCARAGDTCLTPFQCELCHFQNVHGRNPNWCSSVDVMNVRLLRRANLDAFWARTSNTVQANLSLVRRYYATEAELGYVAQCL